MEEKMTAPDDSKSLRAGKNFDMFNEILARGIKAQEKYETEMAAYKGALKIQEYCSEMLSQNCEGCIFKDRKEKYCIIQHFRFPRDWDI